MVALRTRRQFLRFVTLGAAGSVLVACAPPAPSAPPAATSAPSAPKPAATIAPSGQAAPAASAPQPTAAVAKPTAAAAAPARKGGDVSIAVGQIDTLNPLYSGSQLWKQAGQLWANGLVRLDGEGKPQPDLAKSFSHSPDARLFTFKLHENVTFHDGSPVTAADVKHVFETGLHPETPVPQTHWYVVKGAQDFREGKAKEVTGVRVVDPLTIEFETTRPDIYFYQEAQFFKAMPKHVLEKIPVKDLRSDEFSRTPIGTGPFKVASWKEKESVVFEANEKYFQGRPALDRVVWRILPDPSSVMTELRTGGVNVGTIAHDQHDRFVGDPKLNVQRFDGVQNHHIRFDLSNETFKDVRLRRAMAHAINRQEMIKGLYNGMAILTNTITHPAEPEYHANLKGYDYDPARAKALLEEAGWKPGPDGVRARDGTRLSFEAIMSTAPELEKLFLVVQAYWKEVGIEVKPKPADTATYTALRNPGKFELAFVTWNNLTTPPHGVMGLNLVSNGRQNKEAYNNPELDRIHAEISAMTDEAKRKEAFLKLQEMHLEEAAYVWLVRPDDIAVVTKGLNMPEVKSYKDLLWYTYQFSWAG